MKRTFSDQTVMDFVTAWVVVLALVVLGAMAYLTGTWHPVWKESVQEFRAAAQGHGGPHEEK
jgi:hypothetical protein